jgi:hypothetical protein
MGLEAARGDLGIPAGSFHFPADPATFSFVEAVR